MVYQNNNTSFPSSIFPSKLIKLFTPLTDHLVYIVMVITTHYSLHTTHYSTLHTTLYTKKKMAANLYWVITLTKLIPRTLDNLYLNWILPINVSFNKPGHYTLYPHNTYFWISFLCRIWLLSITISLSVIQ